MSATFGRGHRYGSDENYQRAMRAARDAPRFYAAPIDAVIDMRPGGIIRVKRADNVTWFAPGAMDIPNRLHGATINAEGDAI